MANAGTQKKQAQKPRRDPERTRETTGNPAALASALRKLSVDSLSNLNPHPWKVFLDYSHPPVTQRLRALLGVRQSLFEGTYRS